MSDSIQPHGLYSPWNSPGQHSGVGSCSLLQGIFATQGSNPGRPHSLPSEVDSLPSEPPGELLLVAEPRPKPGSFHFSVVFFFVLYSYFNSTHFKALNTFLSSPFFTLQMDSFTLLLAAATKYWYHLYTVQGLLLLLLSGFSRVWLCATP